MTQSIKIQKWMRATCGWVLCEALDGTHTMRPYNQALDQGVDPEDYGIKNPAAEEFGSYSRSDLINEIIRLRNQL